MDKKNYFEQIMQLKGVEELKSLVLKWQRLSENMNRHTPDISIILPDMLWFAKAGTGKTNILNMLSEYLYAAGNLMEFYGDVKYVEFLLSYCSPSESFTELQRLINEIYNAAGYRSEFKGIVFIDIDEWKNHFEERHFISFMEYIANNSDNWMVILSVDSDYNDDIHNLEAFISMFIRIEKISLTHPDSKYFLEYLEERLADYGLSLEEDARRLLADSIAVLRSNKYFDGYKSIKMLYQDIVYTVFSKEKTARLTGEMLNEFASDSEYIKRKIFNIEKINRIGFTK